MKVKDSVLVTDQPFTCARSVVTRVTKRTGRMFRTQTMDGGVRIWRVS